jgi:4-hydroxy-tetrahydrodipicolinate reductase
MILTDAYHLRHRDKISQLMEKLRIGLIGYGRMGQMIEQLSTEYHCTIVWKITRSTRHTLTPALLAEAQVVIEMTSPESAFEHIMACLRAKTPVVTGTTGWQQQLPEAYQYCTEHGGSMLYASNFSVGVNLFFAVNQYLSSLLAKLKLYQPSITETHHIHKKDKPSGTAVTMAEGIMKTHPDFNGWQLTHPDTHLIAHQIPVEAKREGEVIGLHEVVWRSEVDTISLKHNAENRIGFAIGALLAARFIHDKTGVFSMNQVLGIEA